MIENEMVCMLKNTKIFQGLGNVEMAQICNAVTIFEKRYSRNQIIVNQGDTVHKIGILKNGAVIGMKYHFDGNPQLLRIYNQGEVFSLDAVNTTLSTSPVTLISQTDCAAVFIPYAEILEAESIDPKIKAIMMSNSGEILSNELIRLMYKIDVLTKRTLRERIMTYLSVIQERSGKNTFDLGMNQEQFAQYLCVSRSALSEELNRMRKAGMIDYRRSWYTIL